MHDETARLPAENELRDVEQLVALRPEVLHDVEHAVGNLLQRMHHVARTARAELGGAGERLQGTLEELEHLLELFFDYVSPVTVALRPTAAARALDSLAAQLRGLGATVAVEAAAAPAVLADGRALSRSFALLAQAGGGEWTAAPLTLVAAADAAGERVALEVRGAAAAGGPASAPAVLAAAVARRLLELQGGELCERPAPGCLCRVLLPVAG